ncbi:hypothetical protein H0274_11355 [Altererythrobacter sp. CC-YST694]|uniref:hypothetical protein n=1 Tax=Altererythrobacter sp. CC-YST694 TaxID=2755038 RepID=UPI001D0147A4|nr:hypothetical protein [Altererythrobacter sp. CC-YST694]MCB5425859.1 hypothetical protein [Altererythrobacter sp. CC-YST694]
MAARKDMMNSIDKGSARRHAISQRKNAAGNFSLASHMSMPSSLSTLELRRLVATMVD